MTPEEARMVAEAMAAVFNQAPAISETPVVDLISRGVAFVATVAAGGGATYVGVDRWKKRQQGQDPPPPAPVPAVQPTLLPAMPGRCGGHDELVERVANVEKEVHEMKPEYERLLERTAHLITRLDNGDQLFRILNNNMAKVCSGLKVLSVKMDQLNKVIDERKKRRREGDN